MAEFLSDTGCEVILVDNASRYVPLLEWYETCPYQIYKLRQNHGHMAVWDTGIINQHVDQFYAVTDPDLDLTGIPTDYIEFLKKGLADNPEVVKAGFSLKIDDLPKNEFTKQVIEKEREYWFAPRDVNGFYRSGIDTTFAIYDRQRFLNKFYWSLRSPEPYVAKHLPWYMTKETMTFEELYYITTASEVSTFSRIFRESIGMGGYNGGVKPHHLPMFDP